jgi:hypothetical protein
MSDTKSVGLETFVQFLRVWYGCYPTDSTWFKAVFDRGRSMWDVERDVWGTVYRELSPHAERNFSITF